MAKRTTLYLDDGLLERARKYVPSRKISAFINQLLAERLEDLERAQLNEELKAGYLATAGDRSELNQDWQVVDGEGWA